MRHGGEGDRSQNSAESSAVSNTVLDNKSTHITFGHVNLGIQTQNPDFSLMNGLDSNGIIVYPHGYTILDHDMLNTYALSVEASLEGETDLEKLPISIASEKAAVPSDSTDEKYWGLTEITELSRTTNVKVGDYETVYFEIDPPYEKEENGTTMPTVIGYSLLFEGQPVCISAKYNDHKDFSKEDIQEYLQYMVLTLAPYQGEGFYELQSDNHIWISQWITVLYQSKWSRDKKWGFSLSIQSQ